MKTDTPEKKAFERYLLGVKAVVESFETAEEDKKDKVIRDYLGDEFIENQKKLLNKWKVKASLDNGEMKASIEYVCEAYSEAEAINLTKQATLNISQILGNYTAKKE